MYEMSIKLEVNKRGKIVLQPALDPNQPAHAKVIRAIEALMRSTGLNRTDATIQALLEWSKSK